MGITNQGINKEKQKFLIQPTDTNSFNKH